ncbi:helix-turn-helix domain-containing protein [Aeromonas allosaccharophila]|uniref:helix-turn-helix domain-containing protein n=1 Tax=Aeromonas allosaccharophila TaxID=656 RepID=UPI003D237647
MQLKEKRDAAILEKHKEGMSNRAIAKLFNIGQDTDNGHKTVGKALKDIFEALGKNPESGKIPTPEVSTSAVPMANTDDCTETREDARSFIDEQLDALLTN